MNNLSASKPRNELVEILLTLQKHNLRNKNKTHSFHFSLYSKCKWICSAKTDVK